MEIIDAHVNITENGKWGTTSYDASIYRLLNEMDMAKIDKAVLMPVRPLVKNSFVIKIIKKHSDRLIGFGNVGIDSFLEDIKEINGGGLKGIKFHPRFQQISLAELDKKGVLQHLENNGLPITICGWLQSSTLPIDELTPLSIDKIAKKYPKLKIVIAHMGGHHYWDCFFVVRSNPNVFMNCSYFIEFFKGTSLETDFFSSLKKVDQKLIYGSDFPEVSTLTYYQYFIKKIKDIDCAREQIFAKNFYKIID